MIENTKTLISSLLKDYLEPSMIAVDMTVGNGYDITKLLDYLPEGYVYGFDIQELALQKTFEKLRQYTNFKLILDNHKNVLKHLNACDFAIYNLGYLPGGDKNITTNPNDVIESLEALLSIHTEYIIFTLYLGHLRGQEEIKAIEKFLSDLSQKEYIVMKYQFLNQMNNPPYVLTIRRKK